MPQAPAPPVWRLAGTGAALGAYAWVSHLLMVHAPDRAWSVAALFGPLWAAVVLGGWLRRHWPTLVACAAVLAGIVMVVARGGVDDIHLMYVLQHAGVHMALAWAFAATLRPGREPLISALAAHVHQTVTPAMAAYTRDLTRAWVVYFVAMVVVSLLLFAAAPWSWWSLFCNVVTPLALLAFFAAEWVWRRLRHPEFERVSPLRLWQAWQQQRPGSVR
ncbi:MAG: hypothetical protein IPM15_18200 [Betaproteobacteria bacterium]|nr:hypothetical protein [Betaproteobacteria bacterium]MCC6250209.1 hypothetical protein [Rubrivivax sp.]MCL4695554.1 hypothetical protein [Burkholderiaceae bacterium]